MPGHVGRVEAGTDLVALVADRRAGSPAISARRVGEPWVLNPRIFAAFNG
jgi:hypothetical protein